MVKQTLEYPICNLCGSEKANVVYDQLTYWEYPGIFREVSCANCGLVFLSPRPPLAKIGKYYESDNYFGRDITNISSPHNEEEERWAAFGPAYHYIFKRKKKGRIFDVGAGTGSFLSLFKEKGWEVDGNEIVPDAVYYAKKHYGIRLRQGDLFDFTLRPNSYDVISLNGALEHMYKPLETLVQIHKYLKEGGIVIFSVPNVESLGRSLFGRNWFPWQPPRHLYHFSPRTAKAILEKAGFTDIVVDTNYYVQNHYILFNSLRYSKSPKFEKSSQGGLKGNIDTRPTQSVTIRLGKHIWNGVAVALAKLEPLFQKGEVMLVSAKK